MNGYMLIWILLQKIEKLEEEFGGYTLGVAAGSSSMWGYWGEIDEDGKIIEGGIGSFGSMRVESLNFYPFLLVKKLKK